MLGLALVSTSLGQIIITNQATSGVAAAFQAQSATLLTYAETSNPSFTAAGLSFSLVSNYSLGQITVGNGVNGSFFANVSFLGRESLRPNHFGVDDGVDGYLSGGQALFLDYTNADFAVTKNLTAAAYTSANFWHYADKPGYTGNYFLDDSLSFRTWEAVDVDANRVYTIFGIDDLRSAFIDFDDGLFLVERNLLPVSTDNPVPEPSTYALMGAGLLVAAILYRRRKGPSLAV